MSSSNIYNILSKLNALQPKAEEPKAQATKPIYESVEPRGSIMSGVNRLEKKLSEQFAADKKALDTNPKNAAWDADANAKQRARIAREKQKIGMENTQKQDKKDQSKKTMTYFPTIVCSYTRTVDIYAE